MTSRLLAAIALAGCAFGTLAAERRAPPPKTPTEASGGSPAFYVVFGKRYRVRASSDGYRERGVASWYGRPFHGRPTSSGETYDMNGMTAAHTTLPLQTWVEVTNLANGKRIIVKVNDRGPFVDDRMIDLSYAAATALDIVRAGTARVEVRALEGPHATIAERRNERQPATNSRARPATVTANVGSSGRPAAVRNIAPSATAVVAVSTTQSDGPQAERLFAEAGRFTQRADAVDLVNELKAQGLVNAFVVTEDGRRKSTHRVRVGPLLDAAAVNDMSNRLRGLGAKRSRSVVMP